MNGLNVQKLTEGVLGSDMTDSIRNSIVDGYLKDLIYLRIDHFNHKICDYV